MANASADNVLPSATTASPSISIPLEPFGELDGELARIATNTKLDFKNLSFKQLYQKQWKKMQTWGSFLDTNAMRMPPSTAVWAKRVLRNVEHFNSNYLCVFLILMIYCILTSPILLLALAASLGACYIVALKNSESPIKLFGYKPSIGQQYIGVGVLSFPLFYLAGAGAAVFWVIGSSFFIIGLHASIYAIESLDSGSTENLTFQQPFPTSVQTV